MCTKGLARSFGFYNKNKWKDKTECRLFIVKVLYILLLSTTDHAFSTQCSPILAPHPQPSFSIPETANREHMVLAYRHLSCLRNILQSRRSLLFFFPHCSSIPTLWISLFLLPDEIQVPQIFWSLSVLSFISEVEMPTCNVIISTPYSFKMKNFLALPFQPQLRPALG